MRLQGKVAIITGGANGIGAAAVERFLVEGAHVAVADYDGVAGTQLAAEKGVFFQKVDTTKRTSIDAFVAAVLEQYGQIDILINNAGITRDATLLNMTEADFDAVVDVNLKGVFHFTQAVVPHMLERGYGKIVNTSSVSGVYGNFGQTNYAATKAAIVGMTKTWAKEFSRKGINVNAVAPGFTRTAMVEKMPPEVIQKMLMVVPIQRLADPADIANAYLFLASDEASYISGHVLHVDGGIMM